MDAAVTNLGEALKSAKRNVAILATAQAIQGAVAPISISLAALAGYQLLAADKALATAPATGFNVGTALGAALIALVTRYAGRKQAFILGALVASAGALLAATALIKSNFWLFAAALLLLGTSSGFVQKFRFAAADASPSFYKPKAISWILVGGVVSAVIGPQIVIWLRDSLPGIPFAGAFLAIIPLALASIAVLSMLRLPEVGAKHADSKPARPLTEIIGTQRFITGMLCGIGSYALMTFMMTGAPLAMVVGCGYSPEVSTLGIQWHVLAMFGPSFFTGQLITRFGVEKVVATGLVVLMGCAVVAVLGTAIWNFWGALILLGIGWNFGFIGSTAIVASSYRPEEADKVQGFHDIFLFTVVALASLSSGKVFNSQGWNVMAYTIWPVCLICLVALFMLVRKSPPHKPGKVPPAPPSIYQD
ncbi:MFS transporter [Rhizobium sp. C4]|uniref:MFS transporter n=1 Tax=Rhizobium sp. C4 TaxID=1349800 RepID=UPI001E5C1B82|nr:MFS transporter [Rhizobium sp. C4]MCD2171640.1 MFS transporter [Rhizobium sp. C4]